MTTAKSSLKFKDLMTNEIANGALKFLTDNMHNGILPLTKEILESLVLIMEL